MAWNLRDAIIFIIKTLQNIFNVKKTVSGGSTEEQGQPVSSSQPPINAPAPANGSTTPAPTKPFKLSYYVNDEFTDVDKMDLGAIKKAGVGKIYARTSNTGEYGLSLKEFQDFKLRCTKAGLECDGWVFPGYNFAKDLTNAKAGTHIDYETYGIKQFISQIKDYRALTKGGYYSIVSKPDIWDGQQYPNLVMPNVDGYFPMCYLGDFGKTEAQFDSYLKSQVALYGDKFGVAIQAYFSDQNQVPKGKPQLLREIAIAKKYCREAIIFEYGLDNLMATAGSPGATDNSTQPQINPSTAVNLDKFQKLFF